VIHVPFWEASILELVRTSSHENPVRFSFPLRPLQAVDVDSIKSFIQEPFDTEAVLASHVALLIAATKAPLHAHESFSTSLPAREEDLRQRTVMCGSRLVSGQLELIEDIQNDLSAVRQEFTELTRTHSRLNDQAQRLQRCVSFAENILAEAGHKVNQHRAVVKKLQDVELRTKDVDQTMQHIELKKAELEKELLTAKRKKQDLDEELRNLVDHTKAN